jgi:NAD(P) transhydrogenase subunit beta
MSASLTSFLYLVSAVLFILALRGLSHPETSRQGNLMGVTGMAVAILVTLVHHGMGGGIPLILLGIAIGGSVGAAVAWKIGAAGACWKCKGASR